MSKVNSTIVLKKSEQLFYQCRLAKLTNWDWEQRELLNERGYIAFSNNPGWSLPVIKTFNENIGKGKNVTILFIMEDKKNGYGKRKVVRIYGLPDEAQNKEPKYRLTFIKIRSDKVPKIQNPGNIRFWFHGCAKSYDTDLYETDWFFVIIARTDEPVILKANNKRYNC